MKVYILTADRYFPWNGENISESDRIWGNLDALIGLPYLVYRTKKNTINTSLHENFDCIDKSFTVRSLKYFFIIFLKSHKGFLLNKKLLLGSGLFYIKESITWYLAYSRIREYLELNKVDTLIYHGEFNNWGNMIAWACKDSGVNAIAWQHGLMPLHYEQYMLSESDVKYLPLPNKIFLWSQFSKKLTSVGLRGSIKEVVVGQTRINTPYKVFKKRKVFRYIICPSKNSNKNMVSYLIDNKGVFGDDSRLIYKPHPLYAINDKNFELIYKCRFDSSNFFDDISVVIVSEGSIVVEALRKQIPVIVVNDFCEEKHRIYSVEMPGIFIRKTLLEAVELINALEKNVGSLNRECFHKTARYFANDLDAGLVKKSIED